MLSIIIINVRNISKGDMKKTFAEIDKLNDLARKEIHRNPDASFKLAEEVISSSAALDYSKGIADGKFTKGWVLIVKNKSEEASKFLEESIEIYRKIDDHIGIVRVLNAFGVLHTNLSNYDTAMDYYLKSLNLSKSTGNKERMITAYINIGSLYNEIGRQNKALDYFDKAASLMDEKASPEQYCACFINMGDAYENKRELDNAQEKYLKALEIAEKNDIKVFRSNCLTALGKIYQNRKDFEKAETFHNLSLEITDQLGDILGRVECLTNLAGLYGLKSEYNKAIEFHKEALELSESINSKFFSSKNLMGISENFELLSDYPEALKYFKKYHEIHTQLQNEKVESRVKTLHAQHRIESAKRENEAQKLKNRQLKEAFERISMLSEIGRNITSSLHLETVMTSIYNNITPFLDIDLFGIGIYNREHDEIDFMFLIEDGERIKGYTQKVGIENTLTGWVVKKKSPIINNDIQNEYGKYITELVKLSDGKTNSIIFAPLIIREAVIGVITIQSYKKNAYTEEHLEIIQAVGSYSAIALENSRVHTEIYNLNKIIYKEKRELEQAYKKIDAMANHDALTGLPNRRLFMELLKKDITASSREKTGLAILFIDLDNFKPVNDTLGHDAGDKVLKIITYRFQNALRKSDTIARLGGDEFTAIIKNVKSREDVLKVVSKLMDKTVNPIKIGDRSFKLGASIGISFYPQDDTTADGLLKKADIAMYKTKSAEKNGYSFYETD